MNIDLLALRSVGISQRRPQSTHLGGFAVHEHDMLGSDLLDEFRVLDVIDMGTEGYFLHCQSARYGTAFGGLDVIGFTKNGLL